jgi:hypothetical protein
MITEKKRWIPNFGIKDKIESATSLIKEKSLKAVKYIKNPYDIDRFYLNNEYYIEYIDKTKVKELLDNNYYFLAQGRSVDVFNNQESSTDDKYSFVMKKTRNSIKKYKDDLNTQIPFSNFRNDDKIGYNVFSFDKLNNASLVENSSEKENSIKFYNILDPLYHYLHFFRYQLKMLLKGYKEPYFLITDMVNRSLYFLEKNKENKYNYKKFILDHDHDDEIDNENSNDVAENSNNVAEKKDDQPVDIIDKLHEYIEEYNIDIKKNVNIVSKLEFGHIVKVLIIDNLKIDDTDISSNNHTINISHIPSYFLNMIIKYIQYCSKSHSIRIHNLTESVIKGFLQNANCFKATVYSFVKFIESGFEPDKKIDLDYISCFANQLNFAFVEEIDWNYYSSDSTVIRLIQLFSKKSFNVFQIYSMLYYNKAVRVEDFISKLVFSERFPENLKQNLISICTNYANCLDSSNSETRDLIATIGTQESFLKLLLIYMSGFDSIIPNTSYNFNLTYSQDGWLFGHTCSKTIDIIESAKDFSLHDLTSEIISTIKKNTRFNRAG